MCFNWARRSVECRGRQGERKSRPVAKFSKRNIGSRRGKLWGGSFYCSARPSLTLHLRDGKIFRMQGGSTAHLKSAQRRERERVHAEFEDCSFVADVNFGPRRQNRPMSTPAFLLVLLLVAITSAVHISADDSLSLCKDDSPGLQDRGPLGAAKEVQSIENSLEIEELAQYAVSEHNARQGTNLIFKRIVKASVQTVAGTLYHLTLEATFDNLNQPKVYNAKVWTKPWLSQKSLEQFTEVESHNSH